MSAANVGPSTPKRTRKTHHLASFIFDSATLPREAFTRLIEQNGVIHKLVQRLMEMHPNDDAVGLLAVSS